MSIYVWGFRLGIPATSWLAVMITDDSLKLLTGITELLTINIKTSIINVGTINHHDWVQMSAKSDKMLHYMQADALQVQSKTSDSFADGQFSHLSDCWSWRATCCTNFAVWMTTVKTISLLTHTIRCKYLKIHALFHFRNEAFVASDASTRKIFQNRGLCHYYFDPKQMLVSIKSVIHIHNSFFFHLKILICIWFNSANVI